MTDKNKGNIDNNIEEEIEEKDAINQMEEEYEEGNEVNEEDGQEFSVAFDIQINEGSFILLVGKTEEKKLILRLVDKEDDAKPFYQNEFSLDELKEINSYFNIFKDENDAINCIIKHLNESEKEIEIVDDNNIKLSLIIEEEKNKSRVDFVLFKVTYVLEGEEEIPENNENENIKEENENKMKRNERIEEEILEEPNDEGIEEVENENEVGREYNNYEKIEHIEETNMEYSEENNEKSDKKGSNENISIPKKNINKEDVKKNIVFYNNSSPVKTSNIQNENGLQTIIEDTNENILTSPKKNNQISEQKTEIAISKSNKKSKIKEAKKSPKKENMLQETKISKVIEELKDNLDSLGGAMNYIDQDEEDEQEQNTNENEFNKNKTEEFVLFKNEILKTIGALSENFNTQLQKQSKYFDEMKKEIKEQNSKKIKEITNELNKKDNQINEIKNILNEKISKLEQNLNKANEEINKINEDLKNSNNINQKQDKNKADKNEKDIPKYNNVDIDKIKNDLNSKIKEIEQKINELKNDFNKNSRNNDNLNVNIKSFLEKINNIDNRLKQNEANTSNYNIINNNLNNLDSKIKCFDSKIKNLESVKKTDKDKKIILDKIFNLENKIKSFENKFNDLEKNNKVITPDKELYQKFDNLEKLINEIKNEKNNIENNNELLEKVNKLINLTQTYEDNFQNIENSIKNHENSLENIQKKINKMEKNILKQANETKQDNKKQNVILQKFTTDKIKINEEEKKKNISNTTNIKKIKKQKKNRNTNNINNYNEEEDTPKEKSTKNYRVIKNIEENPKSKKYMSQTYNRGNIISSHSVNKFTIKKTSPLDKNDFEYEVLTRPRSRSKEHKKNKELENLSENQLSKSIKYRDINPPIPKEYENNITESRIVEYDDFVFVENRIKEIYPKLNIDFNLVYRASEDGDKAVDFHNKCDKVGPNVTIIKTKKGYVFGGFTVKNWEHLKRDININKPNLGSASRDMKAFGFCVNIQKIYNNEKPDEFAIWCNRNYGPTFKNNFFQIFDNCFKKGGYCSLKKNCHFGGQEYDYEINGGESKFAVEDIEVYEVQFQ